MDLVSSPPGILEGKSWEFFHVCDSMEQVVAVTKTDVVPRHSTLYTKPDPISPRFYANLLDGRRRKQISLHSLPYWGVWFHRLCTRAIHSEGVKTGTEFMFNYPHASDDASADEGNKEIQDDMDHNDAMRRET